MILMNAIYLLLTSFLIKQGYRYHILRKYFTKFYHRNSDLVLKFNCNLKTLLRLGSCISKPDFYGDVVYKLRRIMGHCNFSAVFTKIIKRFIKIERLYYPIILRHTACLVFNPFTVGFLLVNLSVLFISSNVTMTIVKISLGGD
jgi:hypothetical protein